MSHIILTRGIPGSGKSTWSKGMLEEYPDLYVRLNRDDMRESIFGFQGVGSPDVEKQITQITEFAARKALAAGKAVIIDAMNLNPRYLKGWARFGVPVMFHDFPTPVGECIVRDNERERSVGIRAISKIVKRFKIEDDGTLPVAPEIHVHQYKSAPEYSHMKTDAIVVDVDGTLANHDGVRNPFDTSKYHLDTVHEDVAFVSGVLATVFPVIVVTGRSEEFRSETENWLRGAGVEFDKLYMRGAGDRRDDALVKHDIFHGSIAPQYNVRGVFDDRGRVLRMWRKIGLTTFAVGDLDNNDF